MTNIHLKPKIELLDSNFDGYKLKSDPTQTVHLKKIENGIFQRNSSDTCYLYTRMESLHNHLFSDPFEVNSAYVFNGRGHLTQFSFNDGFIASPVVVWQDDLLEQKEEEDEEIKLIFSPSISFPSSTLAVTTNGCGLLNIFETGDRSCGSTWLNLKEIEIPHGSLIHSLVIDVSGGETSKQELHIIVLSVITPEQLKKDPLHMNLHPHIRNTSVSAFHIIYWFSLEFDGVKWELARERRVVGLKNLEFLSLDHTAHGLVLLSHDNYHFIYDSKHPVQQVKDDPQKIEHNAPKYIFIQNNEEVKLWVSVAREIAKKDLHITVRAQNITIKVKEDVILDKVFLHPTDSYAVTWKFDEGRVEICIPKTKEDLRWSNLFEGGDEDGEEIVDPALASEVHRRLAHLTSEQWVLISFHFVGKVDWLQNPDPNLDQPAFNPGQLEACDDASEDLVLSLLDGESHLPALSSHLGAVQHLCNFQREMNLIPAFCLRHDVDGLVWQLNENRTFEHVSTFHAFGYVKASKSLAKFTKGSPDCSYVAVADVTSHVYVFCQPGSFGGELRNRKSGKVSTTLSHQLVISLRNHDQVMGFHATPNCIFILTPTDLFVYTLKLSQIV